MLEFISRRRPNDNGLPQHPDVRDFPNPFLKAALELFKERGGKTIIEIGSMRRELTHHIDELNVDCCMDGHSSLILAREAKEFWSIDVSQGATDITNNELRKAGLLTNTIKAVNGDGLEFLRKYDFPIDLLFLDAWDVDLPDSPEKHLEAYEIAKKNLTSTSLILIDDTDVDRVNGQVVFADGLSGKGKLVIPKAIADGWRVVFSGRQTLLSR